MKKLLWVIAAAVLAAGVLAGCTINKPADKNNAEDSSASSEEPQATAENSSGEETEKESGTTNRLGITLVTTRQTSPSHLTQRPTTAARTTVVYTTPGRTTRTTKPHSTATTPERTTTAKPVVGPDIDYGGTIPYTAGGITDSIKIVNHSCTMTPNNTVAITLTVETVEKSGSRSNGYIGYNCYDADGKMLNNKVLACVVAFADVGTQTKTIVTAPQNATRVEFVQYVA